MARKKGSVTRSFTFEGRRYYVTGKDETDAEVKKALKLRDLEEGRAILSGNMTLSAWAEICIDTYKTNQADITQKKYKNRMRCCILDHIGNYPLKKITPMHCQQVINLQRGNSKYQINQVYQMLNFLFNRAVENRHILVNPAANIQKPAGTKTSRRSITESERKHILKVAFSDSRYILWLLMLFCGCRPSEAAECKGMDVQTISEPDDSGILVNYHMLHIRGTKTANADRLVPLQNELYEIIKDTPKFSYICPNAYGNKRSETSRRRLWDNFRYDINLSMGAKVDDKTGEILGIVPLASDLTAYCLRHTFCTDLQKKGVDIRSAQYLMGHSDIALTANIYTHADTTTIIQAAQKMAGQSETVQQVVQHQHPLKSPKIV